MKKQTGLLPYSKIRGFQIEDCLFQCGLSFENLKFQVVKTYNRRHELRFIQVDKSNLQRISQWLSLESDQTTCWFGI